MNEKLPVRTILLKKRTRRTLLLGISLFFLLSLALFNIAMFLEFGHGKLLLFAGSGFSLIIAVFILFVTIRLSREGFTGMFISEEGLNVISTGYSYGMVHWKDVTRILTADDLDRPDEKRMILIVGNPEEYIDREPVNYKRRDLILKHHYYGSPICFSNRTLDCSFEELDLIVKTYYGAYLMKNLHSPPGTINDAYANRT
jgi:hypothetical protein